MENTTAKKLSKWDQCTANIMKRTLTDAQKNKIDNTEQVKIGQFRRLIKARPVNLNGKFFGSSNEMIFIASQTDNQFNINMQVSFNQMQRYFDKEKDNLPKESQKLSTSEIMKGFKHSGNMIQSFYMHKKKIKGKKVISLSKAKYDEDTNGLTDEEVSKKGYFKYKATKNTAMCSIECFYDHLPEKLIQKHFYLREYRRLKEIKMNPALHNQELLDLAEEIKASSGSEFIEVIDRDLSAYSPQKDHILLAPYERYKNTESYLNCANHEVTHRTGHHTRLNRFLVSDNDTKNDTKQLLPRTDIDYSAEEVTAESGNQITLATEGVYSSFNASVGYNDGWLTKIIELPELCLKAFNDGVEASNYVRKDLYNYRIKIAQGQLNDYGIKLEDMVEDGMTIETTFVSVKDKSAFTITTDQVEYTKFDTDKPELLESISDSAYFSEEPENRDEAIQKTLIKLIESKVALELIEGRKLKQKPKVELQDPKADQKLSKKSQSKLSM